ncbi:hypothetical protein H257_00769 [Aphanomyces astaci]|uniref:Uncharacterized protein n=1 Tax=Aphanomyces astaci TaxID=112090 RepID=W4HC58_APHAT|nr:hypothetical protein H257_00769 [Aphanomyces astaci]ETV89517.1 hypothetical protein H257_00769 [Aphanomyces astaci]|eukprot:XP_009821917.1 hypothetical protein H257_00769 [Aphanomyces astaci]
MLEHSMLLGRRAKPWIRAHETFPRIAGTRWPNRACCGTAARGRQVCARRMLARPCSGPSPREMSPRRAQHGMARGTGCARRLPARVFRRAHSIRTWIACRLQARVRTRRRERCRSRSRPHGFRSQATTGLYWQR